MEALVGWHVGLARGLAAFAAVLALDPVDQRLVSHVAMSHVPDFDLAQDVVLQARPVAVMRCAQRLHHEAPRQPPREEAADAGRVAGHVVVRQGLQNLLQDLAGFSHVWLLFLCHLRQSGEQRADLEVHGAAAGGGRRRQSRGYRDQVQPPRDGRKRGLFATRAPYRPNPIGLSAVRLVRIEKRVLCVGAHDLLDGSPVLDIKPYLAPYDAIPDARAGWTEGVDPTAADHRAWWRERGLPPPAVYRERGLL